MLRNFLNTFLVWGDLFLSKPLTEYVGFIRGVCSILINVYRRATPNVMSVMKSANLIFPIFFSP